MAWTLTAEIGVESYNLSDASLCWLEEYSGLGMARPREISEKAPQQHGATYIGYRLETRVFQFVLGTDGGSAAGLESNIADLLAILKPGDDQIKLKWVLQDGVTVRQIDCICTEALAGSPEKAGFYQRVAAAFLAHDPTFYNPVMGNQAFGLGGIGADGMQVPLQIPWNIGVDTLNENVVVTYEGSFPAHPIIRFNGPITSGKIVNNTTGETLFFSGITIAANDWYEVDTRYGHKTVVDKAGDNKIADLDEDTDDLATFHLHPDSETAPGGDNSFTVTGTSVTGATEVYMRWHDRYVGLWG